MQKEYGINNEHDCNATLWPQVRELHKLHEQSIDYRGAENTEN